MTAVADFLGTLVGWRRSAVAFGLGALAAAAYAPTYIVPAFFVGVTGLIWLLDGARHWRQAFLVFWAFCWGQFVVGYYWIGIAFFVDAGRFAALLPLPTLGLPAFMSLFIAVPATVAWRLSWRGPSRILVFALGFSIGEWLQTWLLTGFPWTLSGYIWSFSAFTLQPAALFGIQGMGLLTLALAALPAVFVARADRKPAKALALASTLILVLLAAYSTARLVPERPPARADFNLRLVQPAIPQNLKWVEKERIASFQKLLNLTASPGVERANIWIWPESALAYFVEQDEEALSFLRRFIGPGRVLLTGTVSRSDAPPLKVWNSLLAISATGIEGRYDKHHLVPFGEYLPFRTWLSAIGLDKLAPGAVDFSSGSTGDELMRVPGLPSARPLICYEAIFASEVAPPGGERASWILNVTNDAWFGDSSGPYQHFASARARAVEQGLPVIRAANNGISGIIDAYGRVEASLGLNEMGVVDGRLPGAAVATLYANIGNYSYFLLILIFTLVINYILRSNPVK